MRSEDEDFIREAAAFFEDPGTLTRFFNRVGTMVETGLDRLPAKMKEPIARGTQKAIEASLRVAIKTIAQEDLAVLPALSEASHRSREHAVLHSAAATLAGAVSGFFGPQMLLWELPLTTTIMMRSISQTAQNLGFDLRDPQVQLECLLVFALGGPSPKDDGADAGYLATRLAFADLAREAARFLAGRSTGELLTFLREGSAPILGRLISEIADQFGARVARKVVAQAAPLLGAAGGAAINLHFSQYFSEAARFHFGMKSLEKVHGAERVQEAYRQAVRLKR